MGRHGRQTRLEEVGDAGQARIARTEARVVAMGLAGEVEARYLAGAGVAAIVVAEERAASAARAVDATVAVVVDPSASAAPVSLPFAMRDPAARAVAEGAYRALATLRAAVLGGA